MAQPSVGPSQVSTNSPFCFCLLQEARGGGRQAEVELPSLLPSAAAHFHSFPSKASRSVFKSNFSASFLSSLKLL